MLLRSALPQWVPDVRTYNNLRARDVRKMNSIISRDSRTRVTADTRGNLGPASVVIQGVPGTDWLKDRWQAASDMGGTAIPGAHWLTIDFNREVRAYRALVDWETAYAEAYRIQVRSTPDEPWQVLYDGTVATDSRFMTSSETGQSPGVKAKRPLHIIHDVDISRGASGMTSPFRFLQLFIEKPAAGWGVSVWQIDIFGENTTT
jgi:hypothetical protein